MLNAQRHFEKVTSQLYVSADRSAYLAVQMGFVLDLAVWADGVTSAEGCSAAYTKVRQVEPCAEP